MGVLQSINQVTLNASARWESLREDVRQKDKQDEFLNTLTAATWQNTPRLAAMFTTTVVSMARFHPLLANPVIGIAAGFVAGTVVGTLAGVGHCLIEGKEIDMGELLDAAATDAFATSKNMAIARGVSFGLGRLAMSSYAGNIVARVATSHIGRGVLVNDAIQISQAVTREGIDKSVLGWEDLLVSSASGLFGGAWAPYLSRQVFWQEAFVEILREFAENMGQTLLNKEGGTELNLDNVADQFILSFAELGSSLKGQRGGTYSYANMRGQRLPNNFNPSRYPSVILDGEQVKQLLDQMEQDFRNVNLAGVDLREANLRWTNLRGADLRGAILPESSDHWPDSWKDVWLDDNQREQILKIWPDHLL